MVKVMCYCLILIFGMFQFRHLHGYSFTGTIPLGAVFDHRDIQSSTAFQYAVSVYNSMQNNGKFTISPLVETVNIRDSYQLATKICTHMFSGIFLLLGTREYQSREVIKSYTKMFQMPYITTSIPFDIAGFTGFEIYMKPKIVEALRDMVYEYKWEMVHYVYESEAGLFRQQEFRKLTRKMDTPIRIRLHRILNVSRAHDSLRNLDNFVDAEQDAEEPKIKCIILDLDTEESYRSLLHQIREMGMNKHGYAYLLGTMSFHNLHLHHFRHGGVNITGFQLVDYDDTNVTDFLQRWEKLPPNIWKGAGTKDLSEDAATMIDAFSVIIHTVKEMVRADEEIFRTTFRRGDVYNYNQTKGIPCHGRVPWMHGKQIMRTIKKLSFEGLTGNVRFSDEGVRKDFSLGVYKVGLNAGPYKVGVWSKEGFVSVQSANDQMNRTENLNDPKIVTTILEVPFLQYKEEFMKDGVPLVGNDRFEGFCVDLLTHIAEIIDFEYIIRPNKNSTYGAPNPKDGTWNGMIGELIRKEADLAVAPLTITMDREKVVDFSKPFMNTGISIMIKKPEKQKPGVFSFMKPFAIDVWICIVIGYFAVSIGMFVVSRFSPTEWKREQMKTDRGYLSRFTFISSLWFTMGSLMLQGSDCCPRSAAGRIIGGSWWLAVLIVISSYTANLAAFLTIERLLTPISSADDLAKHPEMSYGTLKSGTTQEFFKKSNVSTYQTMWNYMSTAYPSVFVSTTEEGVERVRRSKGKYAFLLESVYNDYFNNQEPCDTMPVGPKLNSKGYGIATPKKSSLRGSINIAVLQLTEDSTLIKLKKKWWVDKGTCGVQGSHTGTKKKSLSLNNVAGAFFILIGGLVLSIVIGVSQFLRSKSKPRMALNNLNGLAFNNTSDVHQSLLSEYKEKHGAPDNSASTRHRSLPVKGILSNTCRLPALEQRTTQNHNGRIST